MVRLSLFFVLYTPAQVIDDCMYMLEKRSHVYISQACVVGSLVYEVIERKGWREEAGARPNIEVWTTFYFLHLYLIFTYM